MSEEHSANELSKGEATLVSRDTIHNIVNSLNKASSAIHYYSKVLDEDKKSSDTDFVIDAVNESIQEIMQVINVISGRSDHETD